MLFANVFLEFKFDGFTADTCRSLVAMRDVSIQTFFTLTCSITAVWRHTGVQLWMSAV